MRKQDKQNRLKASVLAFALAALPLGVHAAGLGKLTVVSALGQPLRAEIEVSASREEISSLSARVAAPEAFKNAGIEYTSALSSVRFALDRRPDGRPYLQVVSDRPLNEPFIDMLVEVNWASGRLVREYTFLLDPPDVFRKPAAPAPVAVPELKQEPAPAAVPVAPRPAEVPSAPPAAAAAPKPAPRPAAAPPAAAKAAATPAESHEVKRGDTLSKIASEVKPEGVNLDQMLVALFRTNKDAFDGGNMNRLRAGKILTIPDREAVAAVEAKEARAVVVAQAVDFNAYRQKLAGVAAAAPAGEEAPKQLATGKITPRVEDKAPAPAAGADKLEVSRAVNGKPGASGKDRAAAIEEDLVAREKALKEANTRIAELEKNLTDLKRLAEMRSAAGAKLQEQAQAGKPAAPAAPPPAAKPETPAKPAEPPAKPAEAPAPTEAATPKPAPKPVTPPPPPPPPPSFVEDNPELVFGGAGILALLLGYLGYNAWRRKRAAAEQSAMTTDAAASVFGTTGGRSVDTGEDMLPTDFSQDAGGGFAGEEGVDPVAEADVYIAYGRDTQAEEILLEALKKEPSRAAIHLKLLEIYAARKSAPQFQTVARDLFALTAGIGADWEKATALGRSIDPTNPLYGGEAPAAESAAGEVSADATQIMPAGIAQMMAAQEPEAVPATEAPLAAAEAAPVDDAFVPTEEASSSLDFDLDLGEAPAEQPAAEEAAPPAAAEAAPEEVMSLDFDLDLGAAPAGEAPAASTEAAGTGLDFDLDAAAPPAASAEAPAAPADDGNTMEFDLGIGSLPAVETPAETPAPADAANTMDFDLSLPPAAAPEADAASVDVPAVPAGEPALDFDLGPGTPEEAAPQAPAALDLSSINLDLGEPAAETAMPSLEAPDNPEVATKLELAHAYEEMGDKEGARELLNEVLAEGSPAQQQAARDKLAQLA